ncbi:MAG: GGDEF domain-containing protein [Acidiferrobacterales bacterium]
MTTVRDKELLELQRTLTRSRRDMETQLRHNERIWAGFRQIEIRMIGAQSLGEVVEVLAVGIPELFPAVDCVSLVCVDPEYELSRLMGAYSNSSISRFFISADREWLESIIPAADRPQLGPCDAKTQARLFPACATRLSSCAIAPLILHGKLMGCLIQGSRDAGHFSADAATDLLEHLAAVTAMCVENAGNHERLKRDGLTDALTGVANRRFFERRLREELSLRERRRNSLAFLLVDLDHFKDLNDHYGHQAGDRALQQVAMTLSQGLRASDVLVRYGGEEFALLLPDTGLDKATEIAQRLRSQVAELAIDGSPGEALKVTASIGVACLGSGATPRLQSDDVGSWLLRQADVALYRAKAAGRNCIMVAERSSP